MFPFTSLKGYENTNTETFTDNKPHPLGLGKRFRASITCN